MNEQLGCFEETLGNARQRWATSSSFVLSFFAAGVRGAPPLRICCCCVAIAAAGAANRRRRRRDCMLLHREFFFAVPEIVFFCALCRNDEGKKIGEAERKWSFFFDSHQGTRARFLGAISVFKKQRRWCYLQSVLFLFQKAPSLASSHFWLSTL